MRYQRRTEYASCYDLSQNLSGDFTNSKNDACLNDVAVSYSLAKHGSYRDIRYFSKKIVELFESQLETPGSLIKEFFSGMRVGTDQVILMTPGYRNVRGSANLIFDLALPFVNGLLTVHGYPVIVNTKLLRLANPCSNYASLSAAERAATSLITDHILPGQDFYRDRPLHVVYGDDAYITGESSERTKADALSKGAVSFISVFSVIVDDKIVQIDPAIENVLNTFCIAGRLDCHAFEIFSQQKMVPVIRTISLLLGQDNLVDLPDFLSSIPDSNVLKVYSAFVGNESGVRPEFYASLQVVRKHLEDRHLLDAHGLAIWQ